jgi:hypothetical protein
MVTLDERDRMAVAWLIQSAGGQDRNGARLIDSIEDALGLPELPREINMRIKPEEPGKSFELDARQMDWIRDQIESHFKAKSVVPIMCSALLALDKLLVLDPVRTEQEAKP